jgi:hypothetical protein
VTSLHVPGRPGFVPRDDLPKFMVVPVGRPRSHVWRDPKVAELAALAAELDASMAVPTAQSPPGLGRGAGQGGGTGRTANVVPFIRGTKRHREPIFDSGAVALATTQTVLTPVSIPAYGFLRGLWVRVDATGGSGTTTAAVASGDAPFNVFGFLALFDQNGANLYGPYTNGYRAYEITKYGAVLNQSDPRTLDFQTVQTSGNFRFWIYIPIEIVKRTGLGSIANLSQASTYKLQMTLAASTTIYSTSPSPTLPSARVRVWLDAWAQPPSADLLGNMVEPLVPNHGTTQFWTEQVYNVAGGLQTIRLQRTGLYIRNLILSLYSNANPPVRDDADWPDPVQIFIDGYELENVSQNFLVNEMATLYTGILASGTKDTAGQLDTGVYVIRFCDDNDLAPGSDSRNRWLPTLQSTRLEIRGSFGNSAGTLSVLTNDISPAGDVFVPGGASRL